MIHLQLPSLISDISSICLRTFRLLAIEFELISTGFETNICDVFSLSKTDCDLLNPLNV